jgi:hypothetical protein
MVDAAKRAGHITDCFHYLIHEGVNMLQYYQADGVILLENTDENILHKKFWFYCFETMSV